MARAEKIPTFASRKATGFDKDKKCGTENPIRLALCVSFGGAMANSVGAKS
jgi:hypothetical protein